MNSNAAKSETCQVAIFNEPNQTLEIRHESIPVITNDELLVRVNACTICGSDLHTITGKRKEDTPTILGHEIIGHVEAIGSTPRFDLTGNQIKKGDRLTWSICISCGHCDRCEEAVPQKCSDLKKIGHEQFEPVSGFLGGFAEYVLLPKTTAVYKIESDLEDEILCPANCATATVMAACRQLRAIAEQKVLIIGAGMLGLTATAYLKTQGAAEVTVVEPDNKRREQALSFGADEIAKDIQSLPGKFNAVLDFSGSSAAIEAAIRLLDIGGTIVLVGTVAPSPAISLDPEFLVRNLIHLVGVHNYRPDDLQAAISFLEESGSTFPFRELVEKSFSLLDINEAVNFALREKPIRVMVRP